MTIEEISKKTIIRLGASVGRFEAFLSEKRKQGVLFSGHPVIHKEKSLSIMRELPASHGLIEEKCQVKQKINSTYPGRNPEELTCILQCIANTVVQQVNFTHRPKSARRNFFCPSCETDDQTYYGTCNTKINSCGDAHSSVYLIKHFSSPICNSSYSNNRENNAPNPKKNFHYFFYCFWFTVISTLSKPNDENMAVRSFMPFSLAAVSTPSLTASLAISPRALFFNFVVR